MKLKQILAIVLSVALVACISVAATVAYLNDTEEVVNTFTVGKVDITLDETDVNAAGSPIPNSSPVKENEYKLYPAKTYTKDPTVHVATNSEDCWLFVKIENGLVKGDVNIEAATDDDYKTIAQQMAANNWTLISGSTDTYAYKTIVKAKDNVPVFSQFKIANTVDNTTLAAFEKAQIKITAYAIQADGFDTAEKAWNANGTTFSTDED